MIGVLVNRTTLVCACLLVVVCAALWSTDARAQDIPPPPDVAEAEDGSSSSDSSDDDDVDETDHEDDKPGESSTDDDAMTPPPPPPMVEEVSGEEPRNREESAQPDSTDNKPAPQKSAGARISLEALAGLGGMAGGYLGGGLAGLLVGAVARPQDPNAILVGAVAGAGLGILTGTPLGIWAAGEGARADGSYLAALGGTALGFVSAGLVSAATANNFEVQNVATPVAAVLLPIAGGVIGYELSNKAPPPPRAGRNRKGLRLNAGFKPARNGRGAVFTLGGSW